MFLLPKGILFSFLLLPIFSKREGWLDLILDEQERLKQGNHKCPLKTQQEREDIIAFSKQDKNVDKTLACLIKFLDENTKDGFLWSVLGATFDKKGKKFASQASTAFKRAFKLSGKFQSFIREWHFIGPFVIGKTEFDGDPVQAFGGIDQVARGRWDKSMTLPSELVPQGRVRWVKVEQADGSQPVKISPQLNWQELVNSLGSMGITEWQGWMVGDLPVNADEMTVLVKCNGVSNILIGGLPVAGDIYRRDTFRTIVQLKRGVHLVAVRIRAKVDTSFHCSFDVPPTDSIEILDPPFVPDLYNLHFFSQYFSLPIINYKSKVIKVTRAFFTMQASSDQGNFRLMQGYMPEDLVAIAPGQTALITVKLVASQKKLLDTCVDVFCTVQVNTTDGDFSKGMNLRCREKGKSFIFTFLDHDGSVQHAAAIEPLNGTCKGECPTLLTLHGTTVPALNQADSYKRMLDGEKEYQFGVKGMWLLAPTRHGAHNWEGPGALTVLTALERLAELTKNGSEWLNNTASANHVLVEGHSMGGHGAWHFGTHFPDRAIGLAVLAGWVKKEEYGDSNLFFKFDIATSHTDPSVKAIMEASIAENDVDRHVTNLWKIPVLCRIGAKDRTVHPFFSRRMYRLIEEMGSQVSYTEIEGKEHWWWDTWSTNDGGVMNDRQMRAFAEVCVAESRNWRKQSMSEGGSCSKDEEGCVDDVPQEDLWEEVMTELGDSELVVVNPAYGEGLRGVRILQQVVPFRTSKIKISITQSTAVLTTTNVQRFTVKEPANRPVKWTQKRIIIDGQDHIRTELLAVVVDSPSAHFCNKDGITWKLCTADVHTEKQRGPLTLGPVRRIAERELIIVVGTKGAAEVIEKLNMFAVYMANLFVLTSDLGSTIMKDTYADEKTIRNHNVILVGNPNENILTQTFLDRIPIHLEDGELTLGQCQFSDTRTGVLSLAPHGDKNLALIVMGNSLEGLADVVSLATPTIPPMTRAPFSNLLPDFVITGNKFRSHGPGGFLCVGYWGNQWELRQDSTSCPCGGA